MKKISEGILPAGQSILCALRILGKVLFPVSGRPIRAEAVPEADAIEFNHIHDTVRETRDHGPFNAWGRERFWSLTQSHSPYSRGRSLEAGVVKVGFRNFEMGLWGITEDFPAAWREE
jgi:hypothetical protein